MSRAARVVGFLFALYITGVGAAAPDCGQPLFSPSYKGVDALSNGTSMRTGESCAGRGTYGLQYQCVEYIRRFYSVAKQVDTSSWVNLNARDFYASGSSLGLTRFENGATTSAPQPDDIVVFEGPAGDIYGHVAIVSSVTTTSISIVEQNWGDTGQGRLALTMRADGTYYTAREGSKYTVLGWLRKEAAPPSGKWMSTATFPGGLVQTDLTISFAIGDMGYLGIACYGGAGCSGEFWEFNSLTRSWRLRANHPGLLVQSPAFVIDGKAYVVSGTQVWRYTPSTNQWTRVADIPGTDKRAGFAFAVNGRGYVGGGFFNGGALWRYTPSTNSWARLGDHPLLQYGLNDPSMRSVGAVTFVIGSKAYVTGTNSYFWEYSPTTNNWVQKAYVDAVYGQAFALGTVGYVFNARGQLFRYDTTANSWSQLATLPGAKICYPAGFATRDYLFVGSGGRFSSNTCWSDVLNAWWKFSP